MLCLFMLNITSSLVEVWLERLAEGSSRHMVQTIFKLFMRWCMERGEFNSPEERARLYIEKYIEDRKI